MKRIILTFLILISIPIMMLYIFFNLCQILKIENYGKSNGKTSDKSKY